MEGNVQGIPSPNTNGYITAPPVYYEQQILHERPKPKSKSFIYGCGGICGATIFIILLVGILIHVPWLGIFAAFSLAPGLFIMWLLYWKEHRTFADLNRVVKFFAAGVVGVIPVALIEYGISALLSLIFTSLNFSPAAVQIVGAITNAFLIAALCEESFKYLVASRVDVNQQTDSPYSLLIFGAAGAVGLATLENMMYIVTTGFDGSLASIVITSLLRMFLAVPLHATTGVLIGSDIAEVKFGLRNKNFFEILMVPFLLHGLYDFFTMMGPALAAVTSVAWFILIDLLSIVVVVVGILYAKKRRQQILSLSNQQHSYQPLVYSV